MTTYAPFASEKNRKEMVKLAKGLCATTVAGGFISVVWDPKVVQKPSSAHSVDEMDDSCNMEKRRT